MQKWGAAKETLAAPSPGLLSLTCFYRYLKTTITFRVRKADGELYAAVLQSFAADLQSFAASPAQLQRKAKLVSGFAAVTGMRIAEHKLRTYHARGQQDAYQDSLTPRGLWIYSYSLRPTCVAFKHEHCIKSLGV